jgi:hypothetical protein
MANEPEWVKQDRKNYSKNESSTISSSALIPVRGRNFFSMQDASEISSMEASAPAFHNRALTALKASGKIRDEDPYPVRYESRSQAKRITAIQGFIKGAPVIDREGRKLTIKAASIGHTEKKHIPVHKVVDKHGDTWLEKETNLRLRT